MKVMTSLENFSQSNENARLAAGAQVMEYNNDLVMQVTNEADGHEPWVEAARPEEFDVIPENTKQQVAKFIREAQCPLMTITRFAGTKETTGKSHQLRWAKLCEVLNSPKEAANISSLPLIKFSKMPQSSRGAGTIPENMTAVVGDYDDEVVTVDEAIRRLKIVGISALVHTTRRHRANAPRWRVICELSTPLACSEYSKYVDLINGALGGILAPESWDITRSYFYGKVRGVEYRFEQVPGHPIDVMAVDGVTWEPVGKPGATAKNKSADTSVPVLEDDREFERAIVLDQLNDRTIHDLKFALDAIGHLADDRDSWNEVFLAAASCKGSKYEDQARELIESWSQKYSDKWGVKEDDATKWDREIVRDITYKSIFQMADDQDAIRDLAGAAGSWRALSKSAWEEVASPQLSPNVLPYLNFTTGMKPPSYIWHRVLQKGCLYALTAKWGHGKTALMITVAMHVATGRELGGHQIKRQRVLYLCGENPADVQLRTFAAALKFGMRDDELSGQIFFTGRPFALENKAELMRFLKEATPFAPFGLVVIDTGPAHSSDNEENDNREMHKLAMAMRDLMEPLGNPATVALMHPTKEASRDNLQPRGGGAFSGSIDGELCAWQENGQIEFFHRTKFRGPGFDPMRFALERFTLPGMEDNFREPVMTVLALESDSTNAPAMNRKPLTGAVKVVYQALKAAMSDVRTYREMEPTLARTAAEALNCQEPQGCVHINDWRTMAYDMGISDGDGEAKKKAFKRAREKLISDGWVKSWTDMCWT